MGCDIHLHVETQSKNGWETADKWKKSDGGLHVDYDDIFYADRNYTLFALLADVRNGYGVAGCDTGNPVQPIADPKGLPNDVCQQVRDEYICWGSDAHSASWLTLQELMAFDWTQKATLRGVVDGPEYASWRHNKNRSPSSWCGGISGANIRHCTPQRMDDLLEEVKARATEDIGFWEIVRNELKDTYCRIEWTEPYHMRCNTFWYECMPRLLELAQCETGFCPERVRIVFWFDN